MSTDQFFSRNHPLLNPSAAVSTLPIPQAKLKDFDPLSWNPSPAPAKQPPANPWSFGPPQVGRPPPQPPARALSLLSSLPQQQTDLNRRPSGGSELLQAGRQRGRHAAAVDAGHAVPAAAPVPDFISTVDSVRKLFELPYSDAPLDLSVYRIGRTLFIGEPEDAHLSHADGGGNVEGAQSSVAVPQKSPELRSQESPLLRPQSPVLQLKGDEADLSGGEGSPDPAVAASRGYFSMLAEEERRNDPAATTPRGQREVAVAVATGDTAAAKAAAADVDQLDATERVRARPRPGSGGELSAERRGALAKNFLSHSQKLALCHREGALRASGSSASGGVQASGGGGVGGVGGGGTGMSARSMRSFSHQLEEFNMLVGADSLLLAGDDDGNPTRLILHESITPRAAMNLWLENTLCNIAESVICWHKRGRVTGYMWMPTADIPGLSGDSFNPTLIKQAGLGVLRWLQTACSRENSTYLLHRSSDEEELQLYDLGGQAAAVTKAREDQERGSDEEAEYGEAGSGGFGGGGSIAIEPDSNVGRLCARFADCLAPGLQLGDVPDAEPEFVGGTPTRNAESNDALRRRQRQLYGVTLQLLDDSKTLEKAAVAERLADTYLGRADLDLDGNEGSSARDLVLNQPPHGAFVGRGHYGSGSLCSSLDEPLPSSMLPRVILSKDKDLPAPQPSAASHSRASSNSASDTDDADDERARDTAKGAAVAAEAVAALRRGGEADAPILARLWKKALVGKAEVVKRLVQSGHQHTKALQLLAEAAALLNQPPPVYAKEGKTGLEPAAAAAAGGERLLEASSEFDSLTIDLITHLGDVYLQIAAAEAEAGNLQPAAATAAAATAGAAGGATEQPVPELAALLSHGALLEPAAGLTVARAFELASHNFHAAHALITRSSDRTEQQEEGEQQQQQQLAQRWSRRLTSRLGNTENEHGKWLLQANQLEASKAAFVASRIIFAELKDVRNIALLCCNLGHVTRRIAHMGGDEEQQQEPNAELGLGQAQERQESKVFTQRQRELYAEAIQHYSSAMEVLGSRKKGGSINSGIWRSARLELGGTMSSFARLLREGGTEAGTQIDAEVVSELLHKALELYQEAKASPAAEAQLQRQLGAYYLLTLKEEIDRASETPKRLRQRAAQCKHHLTAALALAGRATEGRRAALSSAEAYLLACVDLANVELQLARCEKAPAERLQAALQQLGLAPSALRGGLREAAEAVELEPAWGVSVDTLRMVLKSLLKEHAKADGANAGREAASSLKDAYRQTLSGSGRQSFLSGLRSLE